MTPLLSGGVWNEARGHYTITGGGEKMPGSVVVGNPNPWQMAAAGAGLMRRKKDKVETNTGRG